MCRRWSVEFYEMLGRYFSNTSTLYLLLPLPKLYNLLSGVTIIYIVNTMMTILLQTQVFFCYIFYINLSKSVDVKWITNIVCEKKTRQDKATGSFQYHSSGRLIITRYPVNTFQFSRWVWGTEKESLSSKIESLMLSWWWIRLIIVNWLGWKIVNTHLIYAGGGRWLIDICQW